VDALWNLLRRPVLLIALGVLLIALLAAAHMTPQMPGQLLESPAEATRWINSVPANWGGIGGMAARALHLYDLFRAPWFGVLVALTALLAAVQLADTIGRLSLWRRVPALFGQDNDDAPVPTGETLARERFAIGTTIDEAESQVVAALQETYPAFPPQLNALTHRRIDAPTTATTTNDDPTTDAPPHRHTAALLARRNGGSAWLRILLPAALLTGALLVWFNMLWSWSVLGSALAPGASLAVPSRNLLLENPVAQPGETHHVIATVGQDEVQAPTDGSTVRAGGVTLSATRYSPAIVVSADEAILAMPGAPQPQTDVAVTFPVAGAEQFVVLPGEGIGIRLVRVADGDENAFLAEVYDEEAVQPISSERIEGAGELEVPLGEETITLSLAPSWSVDVRAGKGFAMWAWLPLLLLALAGAVALLRPATFLSARLAPWEETRTVVVLQGNDTREVVSLREQLTESRDSHNQS